MSESKDRDPVTAIPESAATGRTAEIFADIRDVMDITVITSIWRILDGIEGGLESVWNATRPIYESGQPEAVLHDLKARIDIPVPVAPSAEILESKGVSASKLPAIFTIIDAYNRSNGLNLIALNGVISTASDRPVEYDPEPRRPVWPGLPPLLERDEIESSTWSLLEELRQFGSIDQDPSIATLWRHLAPFPGLLTQVIETYGPLQRTGTLSTASAHVAEFARTRGSDMAHYRGETSGIPDEALELISGYVSNPSAVSRMVMLGHSVARWLSEVR